MPRIEHPRDAVVKVTRSCICGSDLHLYHGMVPDTRIGMTFGHEFCGIVEELGDEVGNLKVGDHVMVPFNIACGQCHFCQQGLYGNCHENNPQATAVGAIYGYSHTGGGFDGGQAQYVRVPLCRFRPDDHPGVDGPRTMPSSSPTWCRRAIRRPRWAASRRRYGAGARRRPVGLLAARSAWLFGAGRVIVLDHIDYRLEFARTYCPAEVYNFKELDDVVVFMKKTTDGLGVDVAIDAVGGDAKGNFLQTLFGVKLKLEAGNAIPAHWAINSVKKGGIVSIVGVYGPTGNMVPLGNIVNKGLTVAPIRRGEAPHPQADRACEGRRLIPKGIITHRVPLETWPTPITSFSAKLDNCIKPVLLPHG
jgi:threonine dehydrogenase-like Zn-dependent dehydrogenase